MCVTYVLRADVASLTTADFKILCANQNCEDELIDWFEEYAIIFIALALGFACIQVSEQ